ncbi:MAG: hypothetical protein IT375_06410 [Polyangiaceae bacterium]|nr:hypothetical protein [Polyangiaceae bacterium]
MKELFALPEPSTALVGNQVTLAKNPGRQWSLVLEYEPDVASPERKGVLEFSDVEAFRCTYESSCGPEVIGAYDKLVDVGQTEWLKHAVSNLARRGKPSRDLLHLMILFDDGPCYEFLCRRWRYLEIT